VDFTKNMVKQKQLVESTGSEQLDPWSLYRITIVYRAYEIANKVALLKTNTEEYHHRLEYL